MRRRAPAAPTGAHWGAAVLSALIELWPSPMLLSASTWLVHPSLTPAGLAVWYRQPRRRVAARRREQPAVVPGLRRRRYSGRHFAAAPLRRRRRGHHGDGVVHAARLGRASQGAGRPGSTPAPCCQAAAGRKRRPTTRGRRRRRAGGACAVLACAWRRMCCASLSRALAGWCRQGQKARRCRLQRSGPRDGLHRLPGGGHPGARECGAHGGGWRMKEGGG